MEENTLNNFDTLEIIGWLGSIFFAICAVPQAIKSIKDGHAFGIAWSFLILWMLGEILTLIYVVPKGHIPLIFNYAFNILLLIVIFYYKIHPRKNATLVPQNKTNTAENGKITHEKFDLSVK